MNEKEMLEKFVSLVEEKNGKAYFTGGYVRDQLINRNYKDIDIEVFGISETKLEEILDKCGNWDKFGKAYLIYKLHHYPFEISLASNGYTNASTISLKHACLRRDFTINALMQDCNSNELIDYFNGRNDIQEGIIRVVSDESLINDPLRVVRAASFSARLNFTIEKHTLALAKNVDITHLPKERVFEELRKVLLTSNKPSCFFNALKQMNQLQYWFKEVDDLIGIKQNPKYHSEGDVYTHTMMVIDAAVNYRNLVDNPFAFMLAALSHDFGKVIATQVIDGQIHSYNHEELGLPLVKNFMKRLSNDRDLLKYVTNIVSLHMKPNICVRNNSKVKTTNKMFDDAIDAKALIYMALSDALGKLPTLDITINEQFLWNRYAIYQETMAKDHVIGSDLIALGLTPNTKFADYLAYTHKLHLSGINKENQIKNLVALINNGEI